MSIIESGRGVDRAKLEKTVLLNAVRATLAQFFIKAIKYTADKKRQSSYM